MMIRKEAFLAIALAVVMASGTANADLTLELTGTPGSNVINYTAGGSIVVTASVAATNSGAARIPLFTPVDDPLDDPSNVDATIWSNDFDEELGDVFAASFSTSNNDDRTLSAAVPYLLNGIELGLLDTIDLDQGDGNDDVELDNTVSIAYPALLSDEVNVISWAPTSGTFTLEEGTFDSIFNTGTFANASGTFTVTVASAAVPEPSSILLFLGAGVAALCSRRRK